MSSQNSSEPDLGVCKRLHGEAMNESNELHQGIVSAKAKVKYYRVGREELDALCEGDEHSGAVLDKFDSLLSRAAGMFWK